MKDYPEEQVISHLKQKMIDSGSKTEDIDTPNITKAKTKKVK